MGSIQRTWTCDQKRFINVFEPLVKRLKKQVLVGIVERGHSEPHFLKD